MTDPSLHDYMTVLRRRRRVIAVSILIGLAVALAISLLQTPRYRARSQLLLRRTQSEELLVDQLGQVRSATDSARQLNNEISLIQSQAVRDAVREKYHGPLDVDDVQASAPDSANKDQLQISVTSPERVEAARLANVYATTYIAERQRRQVDDLLDAGQEIQTRLNDLQTQIGQLSAPLDDINARVAAAQPGSAASADLQEQRSAVMAQVLPRLAPLQARQSTLRGQLQQLQLTQDLSKAGGVEVLDPATTPHQPVSPRLVTNLVIGGLIGLLGGLALAFVVDRLDDSIGSKEDAEKITGLPTLGLIPKVRDRSEAAELVAVRDPTAPGAEAYRSLRTSVRFLGLDAPLRVVLVTSAAASEGKTAIAANLAIALAQGGDRVLVVGADFRRPRLHEIFGAPASPGLTTVLLGDAAAESTIYAIEEVPGLYLMPPGAPPPNPAELLDSPRTRERLSELAATFDVVIVDSPPVVPVTDAQVLSRAADGVLLVVAFRETSRRALARAREMLAQVDAPTIGTVVNLLPPQELYGGQPYRYETYRSRSERRRARQGRAPMPAPGLHARTGATGDHGDGAGGAHLPDLSEHGRQPTP